MGTSLHASPAWRGQEHGLSVSLAFPFQSPCNYRIRLNYRISAQPTPPPRPEVDSCPVFTVSQFSIQQLSSVSPSQPLLWVLEILFSLCSWHQQMHGIKVYQDVQWGTLKEGKVFCLERCFGKFLNEIWVIWELVMWSRNGSQAFPLFLQCLLPEPLGICKCKKYMKFKKIGRGSLVAHIS